MIDTPTRTRPAYPAAAAPVDAPRLAGRYVQAAMYEDAARLRRNNVRVFLTTATAAEGEDIIRTRFKRQGYCDNCAGSGYLFLEAVAGGPFKDPPSHKREKVGDDDAGATLEVPATHNGQWYSVRRRRYPCPVCGGNPLEK